MIEMGLERVFINTIYTYQHVEYGPNELRRFKMPVPEAIILEIVLMSAS